MWLLFLFFYSPGFGVSVGTSLRASEVSDWLGRRGRRAALKRDNQQAAQTVAAPQGPGGKRTGWTASASSAGVQRLPTLTSASLLKPVANLGCDVLETKPLQDKQALSQHMSNSFALQYLSKPSAGSTRTSHCSVLFKQHASIKL